MTKPDDAHPGYAAPSSGYGSAYSARSGEGVQLTPDQEALFPELGELRQQIEGLQVLGNIVSGDVLGELRGDGFHLANECRINDSV